MTLYDYIARCGGQVEAAHRIGVTPATLSRWLNGHRVPIRLSAMRLSRLGIDSMGNRPAGFGLRKPKFPQGPGPDNGA